jgi:hypothetical protein
MIRLKQLAVTGFAVLYGALIMSASLERANDWLARLAPQLAHSGSRQHSSSFGKAEKTETHLWVKKIVERAFVVESPQEATVVPIQSGPSTLLSSADHYSAWTGQLFSTRAPPTQI